MKNIEKWNATKFIFNTANNKWYPNTKYPGISVHSYIIASNQIEYYQKYIKEHCSGKLLDCGCGDVPFYGIYKDQIESNYCVDWENSLQQQIHIDQFINLNEQLNLPSNEYDSVLLSDVLEHIAEPSNLLKELNRVLKQNGKLIIMVPFLYRLHEEPHDFYRYTEYSLKHLLEKNGFKLIKIESYGGIVDVIFDLLNKVFFNSPLKNKILNRLYKLVNKINYFKRINESRRLSFPSGYCLAAEKVHTIT